MSRAPQPGTKRIIWVQIPNALGPLLSKNRPITALVLLLFVWLWELWPFGFSPTVPLFLGIGGLLLLWSRHPQQFRLIELFRPFPRWNLLLLLGSVSSLLYPFSDVLQNVGFLPLIVFVTILDALFWIVLRKNRLEVGTLTAGLVVGVFALVWELAGNPQLSILPADVPQQQDQQFTSDGIAKALLAEIENWPPRKTVVISSIENTIGTRAAPFLFAGSLSQAQRPFSPALEIPHIIGQAEASSVHLTPIYHMLRHFRRKPTLESRLVVGHKGDLTLAVDGSDVASSCLDESLLSELLREEVRGRGDAALRELKNNMGRFLDDPQHRGEDGSPECRHTKIDKFLDFFGLARRPTLRENPMAEVSVFSNIQSVDLQETIERSVVIAMSKISPEHMGLYYASEGRTLSALAYYRRGLPIALEEAATSSGGTDSRRHLADLLVAIANLEISPRKRKGEDRGQDIREAFALARREFGTAIALSPEYPALQAQYGYFLLYKTRAFQLDGVLTEDGALEGYRKSVEAFSEFLGLQSQLGSRPSPELQSTALAFIAYSEALQFKSALTPNLQRKSLLSAAKDHSAAALKLQPNSAEALSVDAYISMLDGAKCSEFLDEFDRSNKRADYLKATEDVIFLREQRYIEGITRCHDQMHWNKDWSKYLHHRTFFFQLALADHYAAMERYGDAATALEVAHQEAKQGGKYSAHVMKNEALFPAAIGEFLRQKACDENESVESDDRRRLLERAEAEFLKSTRLNTESQTPHILHSQIVAMMPWSSTPDIKRAFTEAQSVVKAKPYLPDAQNALGISSLRMGRLADAVHSFELATILASGHPEGHYFLGLALLHSGDAKRAHEELEYARTLDPEGYRRLATDISGCVPIRGH